MSRPVERSSRERVFVTTLEIARFEFLRVFKPKDVLVTLVLFVCGALGYAWIRGTTEPKKAPVTVLGDALSLESSEHQPFVFLPSAGEDEAALRRKNASGEYGALVLARDVDDVEIVFKDERPDWYPELVAAVDLARRVARLEALGVEAEELAAAREGSETRVSVVEARELGEEQRRERLAALCVTTMILGIFLGNVHLFTSITGEKQQRVTESVLAAVPAQVWIDGKLLGLCLVAVNGVLVIGGSSLVANHVYGLFHEPFDVPWELLNPLRLGAFGLLGALGFFMWFAFFGAVASTIDDPNTSSRGVFMFLPVLGLGLAYPGIHAPDGGLVQVASMFPLTAPTVMPLRMVLGEPAPWEVAVAVVGLVAATWLLRRVAGKVFAVGMLTHGSEPSWRELWRLYREA